MSRLEVNRSGELEVFVRVVQLGGFSAAAREFHMTPSAVSKLVSRLENRLATRLLHRSTRQLKLTPEGCVFYERGLRILSELLEAEQHASLHAAPRGRLRISSNVPFAWHILFPVLSKFTQNYPEIELDIQVSDVVVDILEQRTDIAIRAGALKDSSLVAKKLGETPMLLVAAPAYLQRAGIPQHPAELAQHQRLSASYHRAIAGWPFVLDGQTVVLNSKGSIQASDGEALRQLALAGLGLARLAAFQVRQDIAEGRLRVILQDYNPQDREEIHAVFVGQGAYLPLRVRVFLDFLAEHTRCHTLL